jgi:hypothetical protein
MAPAQPIGLDPFGGDLSAASSRAASKSGSRSATLDRKSERSRRKGNQSIRIRRPHRGGARRSGTKRSARIRRYRGRFDAVQAVQPPRAAFSSGASGSLQHLQPPQLRPSHQLPEVLLLFGQSTQMLGASLGSGGQNGGFNPLYQIGGPRSALNLFAAWRLCVIFVFKPIDY